MSQDQIPCRLCPTCPFRPGNERLGWEPGARRTLREGMERLGWFMECHDTPRAACAGFVACLGRESVGVRYAVAQGRLRPLRPLPGAVRSFAELDQRAAGAPNWNDEEE